MCLLCLCARLFICAFWAPAGKGLTSWLSFVVSNSEFVTFPLVFWVRYGTLLYQFLIFAPILTLNHTFGIGSEFSRLDGVLFILGSQVWFSIQMLGLNHIGNEFN